MYDILVFTKDLHLSCERKAYFIFMTCKKLCDSPTSKIGTEIVLSNKTTKQGTRFISR